MKRQLELAVLGLVIIGWLCVILTRCLPLGRVSGTLDDSTATLSRGLIMACIGGVVISIIGEVWFPKRNHVKVASGVLFLLSVCPCNTASMLGQQHSHEKMQSGMIRYE
uniref:Uncharacterized protein n=1 Tax=Oncorhynchus mykiss TaxID=8022 RepID=A0A8C7TI63_ONCMY